MADDLLGGDLTGAPATDTGVDDTAVKDNVKTTITALNTVVSSSGFTAEEKRLARLILDRGAYGISTDKTVVKDLISLKNAFTSSNRKDYIAVVTSLVEALQKKTKVSMYTNTAKKKVHGNAHVPSSVMYRGVMYQLAVAASNPELYSTIRTQEDPRAGKLDESTLAATLQSVYGTIDKIQAVRADSTMQGKSACVRYNKIRSLLRQLAQVNARISYLCPQ